ncbi:alpha/beta-hydrolase [Pholiota conissans]|uniref:Alpha/beta-hydrolase n=1 Tax=Pholiota conissans TaxID=109636 RepID=A0A9P6CW71_9AGAR|nr:alpha/beta-hydrolase [Pholiota conissans]
MSSLYCFGIILGVIAFTLPALFLPQSLHHPLSFPTFSKPNSDFSWQEVIPQKKLIWKNCYTHHQCTRLVVPLNHFNPEGRQATIALIRIPSSYPISSKKYRGPILFNPGGPGGEGIGLIQRQGEHFRRIVGPQFDIVGFDPRGIGRSTPRTSLFKNDVERAIWDAGSGQVNTTDEGVAKTWARAIVLGQNAADNDDGSLQFMNTEQTARDMLSIVEAHGRSKLQYWGFSYGTVLGAVFASLFPGKIERMILDGVVDVDEYFGNKWSNKLLHTAEVMDLFISSCVEAGSSGCAFWAPTVDQLRLKIDNLYSSVRRRPVPVKSGSTYGLVDYDKLRGVIFKLLKSPYASFQPLAKGLADLAAGDGLWVLKMYNQLIVPRFDHQCNSSTPNHDPIGESDGGIAVLCNDNHELPEDIKWAEDFYQLMINGSEWGDVWSRYLMSCQGWPISIKQPFRGPFGGDTSHPILLIGNTLDPVTPLFGAHKASKVFPGSVVLTQGAAGHCSIVAHSSCTQTYIREYFIDGTLPEVATTCHANASFFLDRSHHSPLDEVQHNLSDDMEWLSLSFTGAI